MYKFKQIHPILLKNDLKNYTTENLTKFGSVIFSDKFKNLDDLEECNELFPKARSGHRAFFYQGAYYIVGGFHPDEKTTFDEVWRFCPFLRHWSKVNCQNVPLENLSCAFVEHQNSFYLFGGSGNHFGYSNSNNLYKIDMKNLTFTKMKTQSAINMESEQHSQPIKFNKNIFIFKQPNSEISQPKKIPSPGYGHSMCYSELNNAFYLCCGTNGHIYDELMYKYCMDKFEWKILPLTGKAVVTGRYRQECFVWNHSMFVFGGSRNILCHGFDTMHRFDFRTEKWDLEVVKANPEGKFPPPRKSFGTTLFKDRLFIFGGCYYDDQNSNLYRSYVCELIRDTDLWYLDLNLFQWFSIKNCGLPFAIDFFSVCKDQNGRVLIHGGRNDLTQNARSYNIISLWLDVPPLVESCWNKVIDCCQDRLFELSVSELVGIGIPIRFINGILELKSNC